MKVIQVPLSFFRRSSSLSNSYQNSNLVWTKTLYNHSHSLFKSFAPFPSPGTSVKCLSSTASSPVPMNHTPPPPPPPPPPQSLSTPPLNHSSMILSNPNVTSGQIWSYLQREKMRLKKDISIAEYTKFVSMSKPNTPNEAQLIRTALLDLNRSCCNFKLTPTMAKDSILAMIRSMMPPSSEEEEDTTTCTIQYCKQQFECSIFVGNVILDTRTGLYISVETHVLNEYLLQPILKTIHTLQEQQQVVQEGNRKEEIENEIQELYIRLVPIITNLTDIFFQRCSKPMRTMKKRMARQYKRKLSCTQGPTPQMIDSVIRIYIEMSKMMDKKDDDILMKVQSIVQEFERRKWLGLPLQETKQFLVDQEKVKSEVK